MSLHEVLAAKREDVIRRWRTAVEGSITPEAMRPVELVNHLPLFVDQIIESLRDDAETSGGGPPSIQGRTAAFHGAQRLRLGFGLDAVVREYGALRDAVIAVGREGGAEMTFRELQTISDAIIGGIAHAVTEYTMQRDAELLRQTNEHFAFIAHELRNPLSSAMMALQILKMQGLIPAEGRPIRALERGLKYTTDLVDQTLNVARVASGVELRRQHTTLHALFDEAEISALAQAEAKGVELRTTIANDGQLSVDRRLLCSALGNLLLNAVKYSQEGGVVEARGNVAGGRVTVEVEDCCGGLPPGKVEEAFAPFVRLDERQTGFGLGLAIAKQAVDAHGGTIRVQNLPGKGCIFVLDLPAVLA